MGSKADGAELKKVNSYQWPSGHVAHLNQSQNEALSKFKQLCEQKGYYSPRGEKGAATHDDETLLRYLRARKFNAQDAFTQFKDTEDWRKEHQLDVLYESIDIHEYEQTRRLYPQWTGRRDKRGIPFYVYEINTLNPKEISAHDKGKDKRKQSTNTKTPWKMLKLFALYENMCRFVLPMCSAVPDRESPETPISQSNNIVDLSNVGFGKIWGLRNHMGDASNLANAHYPETLDRIFVIGAPSYFPTIWGWAKQWFDPITVAKIFILGQKEVTSTLAKYVDLENVPKKYGGTLDWKYGDMPNLDPQIIKNMKWNDTAEVNGHRTLPIGPIKWRYDSKGDLVATAIGSENGKRRNKDIAGMHPDQDEVAVLALSPGNLRPPNLQRTTTMETLHAAASRSERIGHDSAPRRSGDPDLDVGRDPEAHVDDTSRAGTYTVAYRDSSESRSSQPDTSRQGTSSTRYEQQEDTHAQGQVANGTPEYRRDMQGEKQGVMDPHTVGQAPKEHPLPIPEEPERTYIDQAKDMAQYAVEQAQHIPTIVTSMAGYGEKDEEKPVEEVPQKKEDPEVDAMPAKNVEEFLRAKTESRAQSTQQPEQ